MKSNAFFRRGHWLLALLFLFCGSSLTAQNFGISMDIDVMTGEMVYSVVNPDPASLDLDHYDFMWMFEDGYYAFGQSASHEWEPSVGGVVDSVVLWASKRYDNDNDPGERVSLGVNPANPTMLSQAPYATGMSRDPRPGYESLYHLELGAKYPVLVVVTLHPLLSFNDVTAGVTACTRQYPNFVPSSADGYSLEQKTHPELGADQVAFFVSSGSNPSAGFTRADLMLPVCTAGPAKMGDRVTIKAEVFLVDTAYASDIADGTDMGLIRQELGDLLTSSQPIYTNTMRKVVVSAWDPNSKSSSPDSVCIPDGEIVYQIQYENVGSSVEPRVEIYDTLPDWLNPIIYDVDFDNPTTQSIDSDGNPATYAWSVEQLDAGEHGHITFKARVKPTAPLGTVIRNRARILFTSVPQDTLTNYTYNEVVKEITPLVDPCDQCKNPCRKCKECGDCPSWWRFAMAIMILLIILLFILLVRALRRIPRP